MAIDPKLIDDLNSRRKKVILSGGQEKIDKRHEKGEMTARDRMGYLFEEGTFSEIGMHVRHNCHNFGMGKKEIPGDGVVSGFGLVDGRPVACAASDFLAQGGSLGYMHAMKIADAQKYALKAGIPMVTVNDSGGARLQEGVAALSGYAQVFYNNVLASGVVPQISMILGPCAGGAAYSPALTDFIIMRNSGNAGMYITGPKVIEQVTYEKCTMDDIGSAAIHATVSGNVHFVADSDAHAMDILKRLLSFLPSNNTEEPPHKLDTPLDLSADEGMSDLIPGDNRTPLDVQPIISRLVAIGDFQKRRRRLRPHLRRSGRHHRQPAQCESRLPGYRLLRQGRTLHPLLQRIQYSVGEPGGRARLPARQEPGTGRHYPPRRQTHLRLFPGHGAQSHPDHAESLRRRLHRHVLQGSGR